MGHSICWDNDDKTVVLQAYTDGVAKDDLYALVRESAAMIQTVTHTVHIIIDERKVSFLLTTADFTYIEEAMPKNQGAVVIIVAPSNQKYKAAMLELGNRIHLKAFSKSYFAESPEQARQLLQEKFGVRYTSATSNEKPRLENSQIG
jgi:hypothetical protein